STGASRTRETTTSCFSAFASDINFFSFSKSLNSNLHDSLCGSLAIAGEAAQGLSHSGTVHRGQHLGQTVVACRHAAFHRRLEHIVACLTRIVEHRCRERCLAALLGENGRYHGFARVPSLVKLLAVDDALGRQKLTIDSAHSHFSSSRVVAPYPPVCAAFFQVDLAHDHGPAGRS